ncbi:hypothetical protein F5Y12DRAFT_307823 [Xylaria sp. FL1777]|nr:hypothetical protein F5Y12DRAFT_307823 [Xylaria sp. FL1777]
MADMLKSDMLKSDILDSIDVEPLKPSTNLKAQAYCATVVSNLEGWRSRPFPCTKESRGVTIDQLDMRVRRLETIDAINPPPPMDTPSWDSLMWRVARLHRKMPMGPTVHRLCGAPPLLTPTPDLLRSIVTSIGGGMGPHPWAMLAGAEDLDNEDLLPAAAQFLCYFAGSRRFKVVGSFELERNCKLALDLSLDADAHQGPFVGPVPPPDLGLMGRAGPRPLAKGCCGCCSCLCHNNSRKVPVAKPRVIDWMTGKYYEEKRARRTGVKARIARVFKKLAFWRRRGDSDTDSDTSSISTRSSSTFN